MKYIHLKGVHAEYILLLHEINTCLLSYSVTWFSLARERPGPPLLRLEASGVQRPFTALTFSMFLRPCSYKTAFLKGCEVKLSKLTSINESDAMKTI